MTNDMLSSTAERNLATFRAAHRPHKIDVGNGVSLNVWTGGADQGAPPLLLLGGLGSSGESSFARMLAAERTRRAIAPSYPENVHDVGRLMDAFIAMMDTLEAPHVDLFGHGLGAGIAHAMVRRYPTRVRRLALASFGIYTRPHLLRMRLALRAASALPAGLIRGTAVRGMIAALENVPEPERAALTSVVEDLAARQTREGLIAQLALLVDLSARAGLYRMHERVRRSDVLLIFADDDRGFSRDEEQALIETYPGARVKRFAKGGPLLPLVNRAAVDSCLSSFLDAPAPGEERSIPNEIDDLASEGMRSRFRVLPGSRIRCETCQLVLAAASIEVLDVRRLEGVSDPADEVAVVGMRCPNCNAYGSCTFSYGPMASAEDQDALLALAIDEWPKVHA